MEIPFKFSALLLFVLILPIVASSQPAAVQTRLRNTITEFIEVYNSGDTHVYRNFLKSKITGAELDDKLQRFNNTWHSIGKVALHDIVIVDSLNVQAIVQEKNYGSWWKFTIQTDHNQQFLKRTVLPILMPESGVKNGILKHAEIISELDRYITDTLKNGFAGNVLIANQGRIFYDKSFGRDNHGEANTRSSEFGLASSAKLFTAVAIMQLKDRGKLTLDDKVIKHFPALKNPVYQQITIGQLLTHSAGLGDFFENPSYKEGETNIGNRATAMQFIENPGADFSPGTGFRYSNTGFLLLGFIIEQISSMPFADYVNQHIFSQAKMSHTKAGNGAGGGSSTVSDLTKFFSSLNRYELLSRQNTRNLLNFIYKDNYGYGSEHQLLGKEHIFGHSGGFIRQCVELNFYSRSKQLVIILSNTNPPFGHYLSNKIKSLLIRKP